MATREMAVDRLAILQRHLGALDVTAATGVERLDTRANSGADMTSQSWIIRTEL